MNQPIVSIQGYHGSYHDIARQKYFRNGHQLLCRDDFKTIFADIANEDADYAVVAIENSLYGSINQVYDLLLTYRLWISGEIYLRIQHCLLGLPGSTPSMIQEIHSHPLALAQCEEYLDRHFPGAVRFERHDTAASASDIAGHNDPAKAAVASREASRLHGLEVLDSDIETNPQNYTRFIVLQKDSEQNSGTDKSSIILYTVHEPGALYHALGVFSDHGINLSKLESRPIIGKAWHYMFYIDFEAGLGEDRARSSLNALQQAGNEVIVLGTYRHGSMPE